MTLFETEAPARTCCSHADAWHDPDGFCAYPRCHGRPPTQAEAKVAGDVGQAMALAGASVEWIAQAMWRIKRLSPGATFIAEDIVAQLTSEGITTKNAKAIGPVVSRLARDGFIEKTGNARPARTSHGSLKPEWRRCVDG